jgi:nitroimidazol reductase NimA-like FMN-containing flavoprotein (pyridoxamine 5'-phosphate oxidase superfamily)
MADTGRGPAPPAPATSAGGDTRTSALPHSDRVHLRRKRERGRHDREVIDAILDEALVAHLGFADEQGQPFVIPTLHARCGDVVYMHGSAAGRTLKVLTSGAPVCLTVSLIDGLVLARSAMHHSAQYRSVVLLGKARSVEDRAEKLAASEAIVEHLVPGRWPDVRPPSENELRATAMAAIPIEEASAKIRTGPPVDDEQDYAMHTRVGQPEPDLLLRSGIEPPPYVSRYRRPGSP